MRIFGKAKLTCVSSRRNSTSVVHFICRGFPARVIETESNIHNCLLLICINGINAQRFGLYRLKSPNVTSCYINYPLFFSFYSHLLLNISLLISEHCQNEIFKYFQFCHLGRIIRIDCHVDAFFRLFKFE